MTIPAQVVKEHSFDDQASVNIQIVRLETAGQKICVVNRIDSITYECNFYNSDYSEYKTVTIDLDPLIGISGYYSLSLSVCYISESTFDLDSDIDILCQLAYYDNNDELYAQVLVFNQNGTVLFASDIDNSNAFLINSSIANGSVLSSLVNTEAGTKMILDVYYINEGKYSFDVYDIPGSVATRINTPVAAAESENFLSAYPVPANDIVNVDYQLTGNEQTAEIEITDQQGRTLQTIRVDRNQGSIKIPVRNFSNGIYFYKLHTKRGAPRTAKVLIVN